MNLFTACADNGIRLKERYDGFSEEERSKAEPFLNAIQTEGRLSVNRRPAPLLGILQERVYCNIYRFAQRESVKEGKSAEEIMREKLPADYFAKRSAFDNFFEAGTSFLYSALNIGNAGSVHYGEYCIIWKSEIRPAYAIGYLNGDSLNCFMKDAHTVDAEKLTVSCACHETKQYLALEKLGEAVLSEGEKLWANRLCNDKEYIEAIFENGTGEISVSYVEEIRLPESKLDEYEDDMREYYRLNPARRAEFLEGRRREVKGYALYGDVCMALEGTGIEVKGVGDA